MPNLDLWINQNSNNEDTTTISNFESCLRSIRDQYQKIGLNSDHPISNERYEKIIEMIDSTMDKYKTSVNTQKMNEQIIIDNIIKELDRKREAVINKKQKTLLKDEVVEFGEEEDTIDYILFIIREGTGKLY